MEVATAVAAHDFQLAVHRLYDIGGGEGTANGFRVIEKRQVMRALLAQFGDEGGVGFGKALAKLFELLVGDLQVPGRFNGPPALLKLGGIGFVEMGFGIALHMHGAELQVGVGEQALSDGKKPEKIVVNHGAGHVRASCAGRLSSLRDFRGRRAASR